MPVSLILAAGGFGTRFLPPSEITAHRLQNRLPSKLFYPLNGKTILEKTIEPFLLITEISEIVAVLPPEQVSWFNALAKKNGWRNTRAVRGGDTRAESVYKGLNCTNPKNERIMVHDGARPLIEEDLIRTLIKRSKSVDGIILGKKVVPTIKKVRNCAVESTVDRGDLFEAETPQIMKRKYLLEAYRRKESFKATDESSLLESIDRTVEVFAHEGWNPKITTYQDLKLVQAALNQSRETRSGFGTDVHRLVAKRKFYLGGILLPGPKGPLGHSDGDVLIHALCDAILGAAGLGDIGEWFSDRNPKFKNIRSPKMLLFCFRMVSEKGWIIRHIDTVIHLEKPKLQPYKEKIRLHLAKLLQMKPEDISIKAKTAEGLGPIGEGLAVSCDALVTLSREHGVASGEKMRQETKDKRPNLPAIRKRSSSFPPTADPSDDLVAERQAGTKDLNLRNDRDSESLRSSVFGLSSHRRRL